jgi:hypothetical protein
MNAYPYCPHGVYVGGCGIDYMCGRCENGGEELSPAEQAEYVRYLYTTMCESLVAADATVGHYVGQAAVRLYVMRDRLPLLCAAIEELHTMREWARDDDDRGWLMAIHEEAQKEWYNAELSHERGWR